MQKKKTNNYKLKLAAGPKKKLSRWDKLTPREKERYEISAPEDIKVLKKMY